MVYTWPGHLGLVASLWAWAFARTYCTHHDYVKLVPVIVSSLVKSKWIGFPPALVMKLKCSTSESSQSYQAARNDEYVGSMFRCFLLPGIDDIIVNSVALAFLLTLDETITDAMLSAEAKLRSSSVGNTHDSKRQNVPKVNRSRFFSRKFASNSLWSYSRIVFRWTIFWTSVRFESQATTVCHANPVAHFYPEDFPLYQEGDLHTRSDQETLPTPQPHRFRSLATALHA